MEALKLIVSAEEWHNYYCSRGEHLLAKFDKCFKAPVFRLFAKGIRAAGWARYKEGVCEYNLVYILAVGEAYRQTIAHEVVHFVTRQLDIEAKAHGDLFKFVLNEFVGNHKRYHVYSYKPSHVVLAKNLLKLHELKEEISIEELKDAANTKEN